MDMVGWAIANLGAQLILLAVGIVIIRHARKLFKSQPLMQVHYYDHEGGISYEIVATTQYIETDKKGNITFVDSVSGEEVTLPLLSVISIQEAIK